MNGLGEKRVYVQNECVLIHKTNAQWGALSNMCRGFPILLPFNGGNVVLPTSEVLYQMMRFPELIASDGSHYFQAHLAKEVNPMKAKMITKPYRMQHNRPDWDYVRVRIMRWTLRMKWLCSLSRLGPFLLETGVAPIVEYSKRDDFWGAKPIKERPGLLLGYNALGRLLMELREGLWHRDNFHWFLYVEPPILPHFTYGERQILPLVYESGLEQALMDFSLQHFWRTLK
ncbi:NADAR family protein [Patescibacteria group bacterium]|nr:NADAR family protein [Patescibacteria group bacterium]